MTDLRKFIEAYDAYNGDDVDKFITKWERKERRQKRLRKSDVVNLLVTVLDDVPLTLVRDPKHITDYMSASKASDDTINIMIDDETRKSSCVEYSLTVKRIRR